MSQKPPHASGAEAPAGSDQLFELVADLLKVSAGDRRIYRDMGLELCQAKIDDIVKHVRDPNRGALITQDVIGRLFCSRTKCTDGTQKLSSWRTRH